MNDATTLSMASHQLAMDLHALLTDLDPARWRDEREAALRARLHDVQEKLDHLHAAYIATADSGKQAVSQRLQELREFLHAHAPTIHEGTCRDAWMSLRDGALPTYEALAASLRREAVVVPSLRPSNYTRNLFHVASALIAIVLVEVAARTPAIGFEVVTWIACAVAAIGWTMEASRRVSERANRTMMWVFSTVAHPHEAHHVNSATWYVTALALLSLMHSPMVCVVALAVLGLADPTAAVIGKRWGRHRLSNGRSIEGTAAFVVAGTIASLTAIVVGYPVVALVPALTIAFVSSLCGGLTELSLRRIDDNLAIPLSAGVAAFFTAMLFGLT